MNVTCCCWSGFSALAFKHECYRFVSWDTYTWMLHVAVGLVTGALGHLLGAAGSVEAIAALLSCQTGLVPPTRNLSEPDTGCDLSYVTGSPRPWVAAETGRRIALTNSFGFGGTNASLCVGEFVSQWTLAWNCALQGLRVVANYRLKFLYVTVFTLV